MALPKLRFKAFDGGWSLTSFQDLFTFKNGVNATKEQYGSGIKFINVLDIINNPNGITYDSIIGSVNITSKEIDKNLVQYGDVLFQRSSETREEVGQSNVYLSDKPVVFGGFVIRGSAQKEYDPVFMNGLLKTDSLRDQITQLSGGSTRFNIGQDSLNKVSAYLPSKEEQSQIASFLSAVDEKITQLTQKHELLSQYKQGMMQKLFNQSIRFKADDGSEFGEWEYKELDLLLDYEQPTKYIVSSTNYDNSFPIPVLTAGKTFILGYTNEEHGIFNAESQNVIIFDDFTTAYKFVNFNFKVKSSAMKILKTDPRKNNIFYLYSTFSTLFLSLGDEHKRRWISEYSKLEVPVPCLEEQTKIANFLSVIDQKIRKVAQQIEETKQWKKGLLQQMFV